MRSVSMKMTLDSSTTGIRPCGAGALLLFLVAMTACSDDPDADWWAVSQARPELPGAHCPEGGTAVQAGIDRSGDGLLQVHEIETTQYVCLRDRVRLVDEPPGARCARGGTAVWVGEDLDKDDVLEQPEVRDVVYVCDGLHALRTRVVPEAPGAPCAGATGIQIGHDLDDDGALDDTEVLITEYACGAAITGDMLIDDPTDVAFYQGVRAVVGNVLIDHAIVDQVELPNLWFVGGNVWVYGNTTLAALRLPSLREVAKGVTLEGNPELAKVEVPYLRTVGGGLTLRMNDRLVGLDLGAIAVSGPLTIADNAALADLRGYADGEVRLYGNPALTTATLGGSLLRRLEVHDNARLGTLDVTAQQVTGNVIVRNNAALATLRVFAGPIEGDLRIADNPALRNLAAIGTIHGDLTITGSPISELDVSGLTVDGDAGLSDLHVTTINKMAGGLGQVDGTLRLTRNPLLSYVLMEAGRSVFVTDNPVLQTLTLYGDDAPYYGSPGHEYLDRVDVFSNPALEHFLLRDVKAVGSVDIVQNDVLASVSLSAATAHSIFVVNNPALPACMIQHMFGYIEAIYEIQYGNDEDAVCDW
jgi:hypothetical protein